MKMVNKDGRISQDLVEGIVLYQEAQKIAENLHKEFGGSLITKNICDSCSKHPQRQRLANAVINILKENRWK